MNLLRRLAWRVVPPYEVSLTSDHIRALLAETNDVFLPAEVEKYALELVRVADRTVHAIRIDGMKPDQLALVLVTNVIARLLPSGTYHVYRGILSGPGQAMLRSFNVAVEQLLKRGYYTDEEATRDREWIRDQVKGVG